MTDLPLGFEESLVAVLDGTADGACRARFCAFLEDHPECVEAYIEQGDVHAALLMMSDTRMLSSVPACPPARRSVWPAWGALAATALLFLSGVSVWQGREKRGWGREAGTVGKRPVVETAAQMSESEKTEPSVVLAKAFCPLVLLDACPPGAGKGTISESLAQKDRASVKKNVVKNEEFLKGEGRMSLSQVIKHDRSVREASVTRSVVAGTALGLSAAMSSMGASSTSFLLEEGEWNNGANWSAGMPGVGSTTYIGNATKSPALAVIHPGDDLSSGSLYLGQYAGQTGAVYQSGGCLNLWTNYLRVASAGVGTYTLNGGAVSNAILYVAATSGGTGTVYLADGSLYGCGGLSETATLGRNLNSYGRMVQTGGLFSLNVGTNLADFTIGRDYGVGLYELSGGVVTNARIFYLGMAATSGSHPLGSLVLSGSGVLYGTKGMYLGYGTTATGMVSQTGGFCQPGGLRIGAGPSSGNKGVGQYEISGGTFVGEVHVGDGGIGTLLISSNAVMDTSFVNVGATWTTTGTVFQTGGRVDTHANSLAIGKETGGHGEYFLSGGSVSNVHSITIGSSGGVGLLSLRNSAVLGMWTNTADHYITVAATSTSTGTLRIEGNDVTISGVRNFNHNQPGATLDFLFESEGVSALPVGWTAFLGGTLSMGLEGGVASFPTNAFLFLSASSISGDFATKNTGVFTVATNGTKRYIATLDDSQKVSALPLSRGGQSASFAPVVQGWLTTAVTSNRGPTFDLALNVTTVNGASPVSELDDLAVYLEQSGFPVKRTNSAWSGANMVLTLPTVSTGESNSFAWDFSRFDADLRVSAVSIVAKNNGTIVCVF